MRRTKLIATAELECGHTVQTEVRRGTLTARCDECGRSRLKILRDNVFRARCPECRFGAADTEGTSVSMRSIHHANNSGHVVKLTNPSGESFDVGPVTDVLL